MKVEVRNKLIIPDAPKEVENWCRKYLVLENPEHHKKERMGLWTGNTPPHIYLYERVGNALHIPFGCVRDLYRAFDCDFSYQIHPLRAVEYQSNINLYPYQEKAVKAVLERRNGILVAPCGSGKTNMGMEIIARVGGRALWLTHTQDLLNQSHNRAKAVLDTLSTYGKITAGKVEIGSGITFATVQTMAKIDLAQYRDAWDIIIVDECQHCCGSPTRITQFYKVISSLSARYKIGLTATPKRADGLEQSMFVLLGGIMYKINREDVADTTCPVNVAVFETGYQPNYDAVLMGDGTINYSALVDDLIHDDERMRFVIDTIEQLPKGAPTLVLANRIEYLQRMNREYFGRSNFLSATGNSKSAKEERKRALQALNDGDIDCLFASYQLAKEGLDIPNLRYVVLSTPEKDETTVVQSVGRVSRKADGKEFGTVIDFVDDFGMYRGWHRKRLNYYKKIDAHIFT